MHQSRKRSLALAVAVALAVYAPEILAAAPSDAIPLSRLDNAVAPPLDGLNIWAPAATVNRGGDETRFAISEIHATDATLCTLAAFAAGLPSTATDLCLDNESAPPHDLLSGSPLISANVPVLDSTRSSISPIPNGVVASFAHAASAAASSPPKPDLRPDHPPVPRPVRNIWAPLSASAPGGSGTWSLTSATWTDANGDARAAMSPQPGNAIFQGAPGTVTVDNSAGAISVTGMQFAVDGYTLSGGALNLVGSDGDAPLIEVGDGGSGGAGYEAVINNALFGGDGLVKTGAGTLVLTGLNGLGGTTEIKSGTLSLIGNGSIASSNSAYSVGIDDNGTLDISGTTNGAAIRNFWGSGSIVLGNKNLTVNGYSSFGGVISGSGGLTVSSGFLTLVGANTYTGLTTVDQDAQLQLGAIYTGSIAGDILNNGSLSFFFDNASQTYEGVISGNGGLDKEGTGTLTLTGANTFTGGVFVIGDAGGSTLAVSSDANLGAPDGAVTLEGGTLEATTSFTLTHPLVLLSAPNPLPSTVRVDFGATLTVANGIVGGASDSLIKTGPGTLVLTGKNSYRGDTTINAGVLQLGNGGTSGSISGDVVDDGSLVFNQSGAVTFGGMISGIGSVTQDGFGTLTLAGSNTFTGGVNIGINSTLAVSSDANLGATSGDVNFNLGTLETTASFTLAHTLKFLSSGSDIQTDAGTMLTVAHPIIGSGVLLKIGGGALVLPSNNAYRDKIVVSAGTLTVDGSVGNGPSVSMSWTVETNANGTLNGTGTIEGGVSNGGTIISQGTQAGQVLTIAGDFENFAGSTTAVALGNPLKVGGTASIAGTMKILPAPAGYIVNSTENLITAGLVTGTFANLTFAPGVFYTGTLAYTPTQVNVNLTQTNVTAAAAAMGIVDPASASAARRVQTGFEAIDATMASGGTPASNVLQGAGAIQHSATPAAAQATLQSLSGQLHTASAAMLLSGIDAGNHVLSEHFDDLANGRAKSGVWYDNLGWEGNLQRSGYAGASFRSGGGMAGADLRIGTHGWLGVAAGQNSGFGQLDASWDHDRTWMNTLALYGGVVNGPWYASAQVANGWYREDMQRLLQLGALGSPVGTASTGRYSAGALEGGRLIRIGTVHVEPFVDARYQRLDLGGFTEQGGLGYGLKAEARSAGRLQAGLGLRAERGWRLANGMQIEFDGSAGWQHTLHQYGDVFDASFTSFNDWLPVEGIGLSRNTAILRAGLSLWPAPNFGLRLGYMYEQDQRERAGSAMLQGTVTF